jgi:spermidine synthase
VLAATASLLALAACPTVERSLAAARFPGERVLHVQPSRYGLLAVIARGEQHVFFHDGVLLFTSEDEIAAEEATHLPLLLHPRPRRVLMVGGGLGGGLAVALEHRPESLDYAEMDPAILEQARRFADARTQAALADPRVHAAARDGRALLRAATGRYDVILVNLPVAQNALVARFSTREFLAEARQALAAGGIFALVTPGADAHLDPAARQRHASLLAAVTAVFPQVGVAPGGQTLFWGAEAAVDARPELLAQRLGERGVRPLQIGRAWLYDRLLPLNVDGYRRSLAAQPRIENRDFRPIVYLFGLVENLERISPGLGRAALALVRRPWAVWVLPAVLLALAAVVLAAKRGRAPGFAAAAAGAAGMALEVVLLLAFQALVGHLYHALGGMLAGFMAGMAAGALLARRFRQAPRALAGALGLAALVAALVAGLLAVGRSLPALAAPAVLAGILLVGATTGASYPLAVAAAARGQAAARIYAWDLAGAAGAALLATLLAIPLLGLLPVAGLAAAVCAAGALANLRRR